MVGNILITGAGGYIGSITTYILLQHGYNIVALDNFSTGYFQPLEFLQRKFGKNKLHIIKTDITDDISSIFVQERRISTVVHFAARCSVDESMKNPEIYFLNNVIGTQNLLSTMIQYDVKRIVFSSTCAVYGKMQYSPVDERHPTIPINPYGESKLMTEQMIQWYGKIRGLRYVILRYFNVCGASDDGILGDSKKPSTLLVQNAVRGALDIDPFYLTCLKVNTPDKTPIRDYINVMDISEAHINALKYLYKGKANTTINLGTGTGNSVLEIIHTVQNITGKEFQILNAKPRLGEYPKMIASIEKAKKLLNWQPKHLLKDSVNSLVSWYTKHPNGWKY